MGPSCSLLSLLLASILFEMDEKRKAFLRKRGSERARKAKQKNNSRAITKQRKTKKENRDEER